MFIVNSIYLQRRITTFTLLRKMKGKYFFAVSRPMLKPLYSINIHTINSEGTTMIAI